MRQRVCGQPACPRREGGGAIRALPCKARSELPAMAAICIVLAGMPCVHCRQVFNPPKPIGKRDNGYRRCQ